MDRILLFTGPSPNSAHRTETFAICPRRRGFDFHGEQEPGKPWHTPATARGTLMHVALAHHYRRIQATQDGDDPDQWWEPAIAVALLAKQTEGPTGAIMEGQVTHVQEAYTAYKAHYAFEKFRVRAVEQVVEIPVPGTGGPGEPACKTARLDLIYENRAGKLILCDHKSTGRIVKQHPWFYARTGQFLLMRWLGASFGDRFGGVLLNMVQVGQAGPKFERPNLDPVPGFLASYPLYLSYYEPQRLAFEESGLPPELWPPLPSEHTCFGRYAPGCPHASKCDVAVPPTTDVEWPEFNLSGVLPRGN